MGKLNKFTDHFEKLKKDENYIEYFIKFARSNYRSDPELTKAVLDRVLSICNEEEFYTAKAWILGWIGWYYFESGNNDKALEYHIESNQIFSELGNPEGIVFSCNAMLACNAQAGLYDLSIEWGLKGIEVAERHNNKRALIVLFANTAVNYIKINYFNEAREMIQQLLSMQFKIDDINMEQIYYCLAVIELNDGNLDKAEHYIKKNLDISKRLNLTVSMADILCVRAQLNAKHGKNQKAIEDFRSSLSYAQKVNDDLTGYVLLQWSKFQKDTKDLNGACANLLIAKEHAERAKSPTLMRDIYYELYTLFKDTSEYKKALEYHELFMNAEKMLFNSASGVWLARMKNYQTKREASTYKALFNQIELISKIGQRITSHLKLENILDTIYEEINNLTKADILGISIYDEKKKILDNTLFIDKGKRSDLKCVSIDDKKSLGAYCFRNKTDILINDFFAEYQRYGNIKYDPNETPLSLIFCPLISGDKVKGYITIQSYRKNAFFDSVVYAFRALASYVAIALENAVLYNELENMATHDYLTGFLNRGEIFTRGDMCFKQKRPDKPLSIAMIDIDHFKPINDIYGHTAGDMVIKTVSNIIRSSIRDTDFAGRYGGEEFLLVLPNTNQKGAFTLMERLRKFIEKAHIHINCKATVRVTVSVGIYEYDDEAGSFEEGVKRADAALYCSKRAGRNRVVC